MHAAFAGLIGSVSAVVLLGTANRLVVLAAGGYFVATQGIAALYFAREAIQRAGSSRQRSATAAAATVLVGLVILGGVLASTQRPLDGTVSPGIMAALQVMALLAALGYVAAFIPPRWLRRLAQRATAYDFVRGLALLPRGTNPDDIWALLLGTATRVSSASAVAIAEMQGDGSAVVIERGGTIGWAWHDRLDPDAVGRLLTRHGADAMAADACRAPAGAVGTVHQVRAAAIGLDASAPPAALLLLAFAAAPLFADDDLELLELLGTAAARAVDREKAFLALQRQTGKLAEAQRQARLGSWEWDIPSATLTWSDELYRIHGLDPGSSAIDVDRFLEVVHDEDRPRVEAIVGHALASNEPFRTEYRVNLPDGTVRTLAVQGSIIADTAGQAIRIVGTCQDVSERKDLESQLTHQAFHDALTGLPNRALFADRVAHAVSRRQAAPHSLAVILLDLDDFKNVNDTLGHAAGDELLRETSRRLELSIRPGDTLARFGGDEFAILLEDVSDTSATIVVADRILDALTRPVAVQAREVTISASLGIAMNATSFETADELMRNADVAMYRAKAAGKRRRELFDPEMYAAAMDRLELKDDLQHAVKRGQLRLHFQPIVDLATRSVTGIEALVRWQHHSRGLLPPNAFISLAEETGLIDGIGRWVLRQACDQAARWSASPGAGGMPVAVNLSAHQLRDRGLVADVSAALLNAGLPADRLTLEITESILIDDPDAAVEQLRALKSLGVRVAIDDFGTGYSSLSYLTRFPIDTLKIDRSFVASLAAGPDGNTVARIIVELGQALGLEVIAEGVERDDQVGNLLDLGCRRGQGYLFSVPLDAQSMDAYLARRPSLRAVGRFTHDQRGHREHVASGRA
jgi:diguanylate cyclase (GGDEF)-like protein/PAS domain S-box-containing protein